MLRKPHLQQHFIDISSEERQRIPVSGVGVLQWIVSLA